MKRTAVNTQSAPAAIGPYSQAIAVENGTVYVSGQIPVDPATGEFAGDTIEEQTEQSIKNIMAILAANDMSIEDVVKTTVLLADMDDFAAMNKVYAEYFTEPFPARAAFEVAALPKGAKVEIEAVAVR
ncbi:MAG TPA: RidA family protein [Candidatus Avilachnospira avicola]|nr:RidA family protein [Candidatus Avilachnospira avicola]